MIHNPDKLTNEQVGVADGWRLLEVDEVARFPLNVTRCEAWCGLWLSLCYGSSPQTTYRTQDSRDDLRKARGLPPEQPAYNGPPATVKKQMAAIAATAASQHPDPASRCPHCGGTTADHVTGCLAMESLRQWLREGSTIQATSTSGPILELRQDGTCFGNLTITGRWQRVESENERLRVTRERDEARVLSQLLEAAVLDSREHVAEMESLLAEARKDLGTLADDNKRLLADVRLRDEALAGQMEGNARVTSERDEAAKARDSRNGEVVTTAAYWTGGDRPSLLEWYAGLALPLIVIEEIYYELRAIALDSGKGFPATVAEEVFKIAEAMCEEAGRRKK